jgi:hypothetical protein
LKVEPEEGRLPLPERMGMTGGKMSWLSLLEWEQQGQRVEALEQQGRRLEQQGERRTLGEPEQPSMG